MDKSDTVKLSDAADSAVVTSGKGVGGSGERGQYTVTVTEADLALGGGHTMPHAEESVPCTVSLTYATPINANKCNKSNNKKGGGKTRTDSVPQRPRRAEGCKLVSDVGVSPASTRCSCARCCLSLLTPNREVCTGAL